MPESVFGESPVGIDLSANNRERNNTAVITTYVLAAVFVALRFYTRFRVQQTKVASDDWMILAALLAVTASLVCTIIGGHYGLGKHVWAVPMPDITKVVQILFAYILLYVATVPLIKFSALLFYRRIFGTTKSMWFCVFLTVGYFIACYMAFLVCCRPVSYYWTQYTDPSGGECTFNLYAFYIGNAAANVTTDVIILLVPVPLVWKLQMRPNQKIMVCGIFMLGGFVCVASIVRIHFMTFLKSSVDITWIMSDVFIWSSVEPCIGIVCTCLPTLQPLLRYAIARVFGTNMVQNTGTSESIQAVVKRDTNQKPCMRSDCDEALLMTHAVQVEMGGLRNDNSNGGKIMVNTDFRVEEHHN
ncbi:hypothetical protein SI65_05999 [Aspergillus cristatus]|uniref:Rhodopsin domain-containing protein n=1 Tax=Aspergillus cristatus TaxID=573508 RepID=A0A1E3BB74_ASPCR|nr:hypothetical protein SI65_05999 [Aspergillus cristatus]